MGQIGHFDRREPRDGRRRFSRLPAVGTRGSRQVRDHSRRSDTMEQRLPESQKIDFTVALSSLIH